MAAYLDTYEVQLIAINVKPMASVVSSLAEQKQQASAAESVKTTRSREVKIDSQQNKKFWKGSDIAKMKPWEFEKFEKEIDLARQEGRINMNS